MKKFEDKVGIKAPFVPFMQYWPTYDSMDRRQKAWYFYWRNEVRNGRYPDTDLSYIFVHIYEILSGCGWKEANVGYNQLIMLWEAYKERFPKLDNYLFDWTHDFAQLHNLDYWAPEGSDLRCKGCYRPQGHNPQTVLYPNNILRSFGSYLPQCEGL